MYWRCLKIFTIDGLRVRAMTIKQNRFINGSELERSWYYPGQKLNGNQSWFWKWNLSQMSHFYCQNRTLFASWLCRDGFQMFLGVGALWPVSPVWSEGSLTDEDACRCRTTLRDSQRRAWTIVRGKSPCRYHLQYLQSQMQSHLVLYCWPCIAAYLYGTEAVLLPKYAKDISSIFFSHLVHCKQEPNSESTNCQMNLNK